MKKCIIAGSRSLTDYNLVEKTVMRYFKAHDLHRADVEIVSGNAYKGADKLGEQYANKYGLKLTKFPADWNKYGKSAGYIRNAQMAKYADILFAFWDGESKGTKIMIDLANKEGIEIILTQFGNTNTKIQYTADDEEPDCLKCDYVTSATESFCRNCGNNYWCNYRRTL